MALVQCCVAVLNMCYGNGLWQCVHDATLMRYGVCDKSLQ